MTIKDSRKECRKWQEKRLRNKSRLLKKKEKTIKARKQQLQAKEKRKRTQSTNTSSY